MISKLATICLLASAWLSLAAPAANDLQNISPGCKVKFVNVETSSTLRSYGLKDALFLPVVPSSQDKSQYFKVVQSGQSTWFIQSRVNHGFAAIQDGEIVTTHEPVEWFISYAGDAAHLIKAPYDDLVWTAGQEIEYYERHILAAGANGTDSQKWYIDVECD